MEFDVHHLELPATGGGDWDERASILPHRGVFALFDGEPGGYDLPTHVAAQRAMEGFEEALVGWSPNLAGTSEAEALLVEAVRATSLAVDALAPDPAYRGLAASMVAVAIGPAGWTTAHVGDARAYSYGTAAPFKITRDHSLLEQLAEMGDREGMPEGMPDDPARLSYIITHTLGLGQDPSPRVTSGGEAQSFLLCTHGFWRPIEDDLLHLLSRNPEPSDLFAKLEAGLQRVPHPAASALAIRPRPADYR